MKQKGGRAMKKKEINFKKLFKDLLPIIIYLCVIGTVALVSMPYLRLLSTAEGREQFKAWVDGFGFGGWLVTFGIQLLQIFVAFIPGEPIEVALGYVWGPWLGAFTCMLGILIGTTVVYFLVKKLGMRFLKQMGIEDLERFSFLKNKSRIEITLFILYFIPGTPKDTINYIAPLAPIPPLTYFLTATVARIPTIISSTILGDRIAEGDYREAIIVFVVIAVVSILGIIFGNRFIEKRREKANNSGESLADEVSED